jgi:hypothetical protein
VLHRCAVSPKQKLVYNSCMHYQIISQTHASQTHVIVRAEDIGVRFKDAHSLYSTWTMQNSTSWMKLNLEFRRSLHSVYRRILNMVFLRPLKFASKMPDLSDLNFGSVQVGKKKKKKKKDVSTLVQALPKTDQAKPCVDTKSSSTQYSTM